MAIELVQMKRKDFERLEGEELCRQCILPTVYRVRGTEMSVRRRIYEGLSPGQKAVLAFWVIYNHGRLGWTSLCQELPHLVGHEAFWVDIRWAAQHLELPQLLESTEEFLRLSHAPKRSAAGLARLDEGLARMLPRQVETVGAFIHAHPSDFVRFQA